MCLWRVYIYTSVCGIDYLLTRYVDVRFTYLRDARWFLDKTCSCSSLLSSCSSVGLSWDLFSYSASNIIPSSWSLTTFAHGEDSLAVPCIRLLSGTFAEMKNVVGSGGGFGQYSLFPIRCSRKFSRSRSWGTFFRGARLRLADPALERWFNATYSRLFVFPKNID